MALDRAVFFDKDGTLIENVPYNVDPTRVRLMPGALEALRLCQDAGYRLFLVSNQPGVAEGRFESRALEIVSRRIAELVAGVEVRFGGFFYCPHSAQGGCECRKPEPGLILRAAQQHRVDLAESWIVGDILDDVEAGKRAGCRAILIDNGNETEWKAGPWRQADRNVSNLLEAAREICD